jgi:hypothetical protein
MRLLRDVVGIILILFAWLNPLGLDAMVRVIIFIVGFDAMEVFSKIVTFAIDFLLGFFGWLGLTLLILVGVESVLMLMKKEDISKVVKPVSVFVIGLISIGFQPALVAAGIDLLLNIGLGK